jgi:hypothetical protein
VSVHYRTHIHRAHPSTLRGLTRVLLCRVGVRIDARRRDSEPTLELLLEYWRFDRNFERNMDLLKFFLEVLPACVCACVCCAHNTWVSPDVSDAERG